MNTVARSVDVCVCSVLFTDLVGFTEYNELVGDQAALPVLEQQSALVEECLGLYSGARVVKEMGDGLMLHFGSATDGLLCAAELLDVMTQAHADGSFPLAVRMGLHYGEAMVRGDDLVGQMVNIAARVSDLAGPGELLISEDAAKACGSVDQRKSLKPIGPAAVKGVKDPIWLHRFVM